MQAMKNHFCQKVPLVLRLLGFKNPSIEERILDNLDFGVDPGVAEDIKFTSVLHWW